MKTLTVRVTAGEDETIPEAVYARKVSPVRVPRVPETEAETVIEVLPANKVDTPSDDEVASEGRPETAAVLLAVMITSRLPVLVISQYTFPAEKFSFVTPEFSCA